MASYTSKPVTIQAFQLGVDDKPQWYLKAIDLGTVRENRNMTGLVVEIRTLEGIMTAVEAERPYIIQGTEGELYPCKASVFKAKYVKDEVQTPNPSSADNVSGWARSPRPQGH